MRARATESAPSAPRVTLAVLAMAAGTFGMLQALVSPALPTLQRELGTSQATATWVMTAFLVSAAVSTPIIGRLGDVHGKERFLIIAIAGTGTGCLLGALAPDIMTLIAGRVLQGIGGATVPLAFGLIREHFRPVAVPGVIGFISSTLGVGGGIGTVAAGPIVEAIGWRWLFWIPLGICVINGVLATALVRERRATGRARVNWWAALLLAAWLVSFLLPLSQGASWGWDTPPVIASFCLAILLFAGWMLVETRSRAPLIDMRLLRRPLVALANAAAFFFGAGVFAVIAFLPQFVQTPSGTGYGLGLSLTEAGFLRLPMLVTLALGGAVSGWLVRAGISSSVQLMLAGVLASSSLFAFAFLHEQAWQPTVVSGVYGLGVGLAWASLGTIVVHAVPHEHTSMATGMNVNIRNIGGAVGTALAGSIIVGTMLPSGFPAESGYVVTFALLGVLAAAAAVLAALMPRHRAR